MVPMTHVRILAAALAAPLLLAACDFGETRPFNYKKGTYLGKQHTPLDKSTLASLKARTVHQAGPGFDGTDSSGAATATPAHVRPPESRPMPAAAQTTLENVTDATGEPVAGSRESQKHLRDRAARQGAF